MKRSLRFGLCLLGFGLVGCLEEKDSGADPGCACTTEYRMNICVTWDGSDELPVGNEFLRERQDGTRDSLSAGMNCFGELTEPQRILVLHYSEFLDSSTIVDSSTWFTPQTVDCCHGEAKTIDFVK